MIGTTQDNALILVGFIAVGLVLYITRNAGKETIVHTREGNTNTLKRWSRKIDTLKTFKRQALYLYVFLLLVWLVSLVL